MCSILSNHRKVGRRTSSMVRDGTAGPQPFLLGNFLGVFYIMPHNTVQLGVTCHLNYPVPGPRSHQVTFPPSTCSSLASSDPTSPSPQSPPTLYPTPYHLPRFTHVLGTWHPNRQIQTGSNPVLPKTSSGSQPGVALDAAVKAPLQVSTLCFNISHQNHM